jgi:hypothetical protein
MNPVSLSALRTLLTRSTLLAGAAWLLVAPVFTAAQTTPDAGFEAARRQIGDYEVSVHIRPSRLIVGSGHFEIAVKPLRDDTPPVNALVRLTGTPRNGEAQTARALNTPDMPDVYVTNLELERAGTWDMSVEVDAGGNHAAVEFQVEVFARARDPGSSATGTAVWALVVVAFAGGAVWLVVLSRRSRRLHA